MSQFQGTLVTLSRGGIGSGGSSMASANSYGLTNIVYPSTNGGWRDIYRSGWLPGWFNQRWGGVQVGTELVDDITSKVYSLETAAGFMDCSNTTSLTTTNTQIAQTFYVPETYTPTEIWVRMFKQGNPTDNVTFDIYNTDSGGNPTTSIATLTPVSMKLVMSMTVNNTSAGLQFPSQVGNWYRITGTFPSLSAGTRYALVIGRSGTASNSSTVYFPYYEDTTVNYNTAISPYPYGKLLSYSSSWTANTRACLTFVLPSVSQFLGSGGAFDKQLTFNQSTLNNSSRVLTQKACNFFDGVSGTSVYRGRSPANLVLLDIRRGMDHDRIFLGTDSGGNPYVKLYTNSGTSYTVTGISPVTSGNNDIAIIYRCAGDGADYLKLYVNGVSQGTPITSATFTMSSNFKLNATAWLGGGFPGSPTWTQDMQMTSLPSAQGWTWTSSSSESGAMVISNSKLRQVKSGISSTGYYLKTGIGLSNSTGWTVSAKLRISAGNPLTALPGVIIGPSITIEDGTRGIAFVITDRYIASIGGSSYTDPDMIYACDFSKAERIVTICGKGTDYFVFVDGTLALEGTNSFINTTTNNRIYFGEMFNTVYGSSPGFDVTWSYFKYYTGGSLLSTAATNAVLNEFAHFSGDQSTLVANMYNSTTPVSVKQYCGVSRNYLENINKKYTSELSYCGGAYPNASYLTQIPEVNSFYIGEDLEIDYSLNIAVGNSQGYAIMAITIDGVQILERGTDNGAQVAVGVNSYNNSYLYKTTAGSLISNSLLGLHRVAAKWYSPWTVESYLCNTYGTKISIEYK